MSDGNNGRNRRVRRRAEEIWASHEVDPRPLPEPEPEAGACAEQVAR